jgi:hypothetical protein
MPFVKVATIMNGDVATRRAGVVALVKAAPIANRDVATRRAGMIAFVKAATIVNGDVVTQRASGLAVVEVATNMARVEIPRGESTPQFAKGATITNADAGQRSGILALACTIRVTTRPSLSATGSAQVACKTRRRSSNTRPA